MRTCLRSWLVHAFQRNGLCEKYMHEMQEKKACKRQNITLTKQTKPNMYLKR